MIGLRTGRAVVIDDDREDSTALLAAFSTLGIAATSYSGAKEGLPEEKLKGVRLVALDLNLTGDGSKELKGMIQHTLTVLRAIIDEENGPFLILAWTTSPDEAITELTTLLPELLPAARPPFVIPFKKVDAKEAGKFDHKKIVARIREVAAKWSPLDLLMYWEQLVHDSASATVFTLKGLARDDSLDKWKIQLGFTLRSLAEATLGSEPSDSEAFLRGLTTTLTTVHQDRAEHSTQQIPKEISESVKSIQSASGDRSGIRGPLNRILLTTSVVPGDYTPRSGNLYVDSDKSKLPVADYPADLSSWAKELFNNVGVSPLAQKSCEQLEALDKEGKLDAGQRATLEKLKKSRAEAEGLLKKVLDGILRAQIEITPVCDYAQQKHGLPRLIPGLLVNADIAGSIKSATEYLWIGRPTHLGIKDSTRFPQKDYVLVADVRYLTTTGFASFKDIAPVCRLRKGTLASIQATVSGHAARPGVTSLG